MNNIVENDFLDFPR